MLAFALLSLAASVSAHGFIDKVRGSNGKTTQGFGVNLQAGFNDQNVAVFNNGPCGQTNGRVVDIAAGIRAAAQTGFVAVTPGGQLTGSWEQITSGSDGAGPGSASIDTVRGARQLHRLTSADRHRQPLPALDVREELCGRRPALVERLLDQCACSRVDAHA